MDTLRRSLEGVPIVDFGEYQYFVHPITDGIPYIHPELLRDVSNEIIRMVDFDDVDRILAPEAMGIHIGTALSLQVDVPLAIARKRSYGLDGEVSVSQVTGYDENELYLNGITEDHTVLAVDDVVSTGGTRDAIVTALETIGADLRGFITVFDKRDAVEDYVSKDSENALLTVIIEDDSVTILDE